jgi:transcriptional regulator with XRE-family HTH domain
MKANDILLLIGERLRRMLKTGKISQEKLAELSGLHPTFISDIERGKSNAGILTYYQVAKALDIPLSDLIKVPAGKIDKKTEAQIAEMAMLVRKLRKSKQIIFFSVLKGLLTVLESIESK